MRRSGAFTLIELLISIVLVSLVLLGLYRSLEIQRRSNRQLYRHLQKTMEDQKVLTALYRDLLSSDGRIEVKKGEFDRLCIEHTVHSLYGLSAAKVCWAVGGEDHSLYRIEGNGYRLPLGEEDRVEVDEALKGVELFDLYREGSRVLVVLQAKGSAPRAFLVPSVGAPPKPKKGKKARKAPKPTDLNSTALPSGGL